MVETQAAPQPDLSKLLLLLSASTGLVDAISILGLGRVFTANMTGNIVFLGFAVAGATGFSIASPLVALAAFLAGAVAAGRTGRRFVDRPLRGWLIAAAGVEAALMCLAAGIATGFKVDRQSPAPHLLAMVALTALAMGFRNGTIRQLKAPDLTTTVLTLTLTGLAADSSLAGGSNPNWRRRFAGVLAMFAGAALGAVLVVRLGLVAPLLLAGAVVLFGTLGSLGLAAPRSQPGR